jgi:hypothetical protein
MNLLILQDQTKPEISGNLVENHNITSSLSLALLRSMRGTILRTGAVTPLSLGPWSDRFGFMQLSKMHGPHSRRCDGLCTMADAVAATYRCVSVLDEVGDETVCDASKNK